MKKKTLGIVFFLIVFGLPVGWYLFLQIFGENKFDLPKLERWDQSCMETTEAVILVSDTFHSEWPNLFQRISSKVDGQSIFTLDQIDLTSCNRQYPLYLIDKEGWIRGQFVASREEVDRLLAEMDIYLVNEKNEPDSD